MEFLRIEIEIIIGSGIEEGNKKQITSKYLKNQIQKVFFFFIIKNQIIPVHQLFQVLRYYLRANDANEFRC